MTNIPLNDSDILKLLLRIDEGYEPNEEENRVLADRKSLYLVNQPITKLPESTGRLTALESLDLTYSNIAEIPESIGKLKCLKYLALGDTQIVKIPDTLRYLPKLDSVYIWGTRMKELPEWIGELQALMRIDLHNLTLERIPRSLAHKGLPFVETSLSDGIGINIAGTKLLTQDVSIFLNAPELIPSLYDEEQVIVPECKVIFLGNGEAGKTYTIRRIENEGEEEKNDNTYKTKETPGVEISDYHVNGTDGSFDIHFWDFGGQDILHSMHRCFLTDNTGYVVMVKTRETNPDNCARFWLRNVKAFAPNSPVLLFINLWEDDDGLRVIDETRLRKDYPNVKKIVYCSAKKASQKVFRETVMDSIIGMAEEYRDEMRSIPASFDAVRRKIIKENEIKDILDKTRYRKICEASGVEDAEAPALLTYLNRLGVCFSYHLNATGDELKKYKLLKPIWLTNAIYAIIKEGAANASEGRIKASSIHQMLVNPAPEIVDGKQYTRTAPRIRYKKNEPDYVLAVAEAYSLCYRVDEDLLFFPALCPKDSPKEALEEPDGFPCHAEYRFKYEYLPDTVVHKLMIRLLKKDLNVQHCWHDGTVVGCWDEHKIIIRMVDDDRTLRIDVYSKEGMPVFEAFPLIREEILCVNSDLGIKAKEIISDGEDEFTMAALVSSVKDGDDRIRGSHSGKAFSSIALLQRFYDAIAIAEMGIDEKGYVYRKPYQFHKASKDDPIVKRAIYESYRKTCQYCGAPITWNEMNIDHIIPMGYKPDEDERVEFYLGELRSSGFDTKNPNYIENYVPTHRYCNIRKSNNARTVSTLREYHAIAIDHTNRILELIKKYKEECKPQ